MVLYEPDISIKTFKLILNCFKNSLSDTEFKRWNTQIHLLQQYVNTQETIPTNLKRKGVIPK